ncbi:MAG: septum site-determining protein MinC [Gammaproteobacteria bacterium]|nr:MAG: septum site-determining protein MinC [Gammaproteobacteria bacterium]
MSIIDAATELEQCFKLKGSRVTITILELYRYDYQEFTEQLANTVQTAPDFFRQMPVILSLEKYQGEGFIDFIEVSELCREYGLVPVAVRGGTEEQAVSANVAGLAQLPASHEREATPPPAKQEPVAQETQAVHHNAKPDGTDSNNSNGSENLLITTPVRSGQQVFAPKGDLIIVAPVSAGAEVLASGNIHVYGPLRGRALAGVNGDSSARIFCQSLEAELVSIAGSYKVNEDLRKQNWKDSIQARLENEQLVIDKLN